GIERNWAVWQTVTRLIAHRSSPELTFVRKSLVKLEKSAEDLDLCRIHMFPVSQNDSVNPLTIADFTRRLDEL
ncbi:MAG: hypothetical protein O2856_13335, partial [Planctomycetota bacterium]|nr:hypothetical protein [Planctomycetota bacterium]